jgi:glutaredoxin
MRVIRWSLGRVILLANFVFSPKSPKRAASLQNSIDIETQSLALYQLPACPFCVKVRRAMKRNGLNIELRNINQQNDYREELIREGGKRTVPCLRIAGDNGQFEWLYESKSIISYLEKIAK